MLKCPFSDLKNVLLNSGITKHRGSHLQIELKGQFILLLIFIESRAVPTFPLIKRAFQPDQYCYGKSCNLTNFTVTIATFLEVIFIFK